MQDNKFKLIRTEPEILITKRILNVRFCWSVVNLLPNPAYEVELYCSSCARDHTGLPITYFGSKDN